MAHGIRPSMASSTPPFLLLFALVAVAVAVASASEERARVTPTMIHCYPTQAQAQATSNASMLSLLGALPSAAAPTGFASLRSASRDRAFARGLCFGHAAPSECRACLSVAARKLTDGCGARARRAGVWTDGCFASYAHANASSPSYDGFRARVISGADPLAIASNSSYELQSLADLAWNMGPVAAAKARMQAAADWTAVASDKKKKSTVRVLAQCARDRTPAECARCIQYSARVAESCAWCPRHSARAADTCCWGLDAWRDGVAAAVVGFDCYLRFDVATAPVLQSLGKLMEDHPVLIVLLGLVVLGLGSAAFLVLIVDICWLLNIKMRPINNAAVAAVAGPRARAEVEMNPPLARVMV